MCAAGPVPPFRGGTAGRHKHPRPRRHAAGRGEARGGPSAIAVAFKNRLAGRLASSLFLLFRPREGQAPAARRGSPRQPAGESGSPLAPLRSLPVLRDGRRRGLLPCPATAGLGRGAARRRVAAASVRPAAGGGPRP